jgi:hypothetical protein
MEEERKAQIRNSSSTYIFRNHTPANPVPFTETAISAADFARTVVGAVTKSSPPRAVWAGANARDGWLLDTFLPRSTVVRTFERLLWLAIEFEWKGLGCGEHVRDVEVGGPSAQRKEQTYVVM